MGAVIDRFEAEALAGSRAEFAHLDTHMTALSQALGRYWFGACEDPARWGGLRWARRCGRLWLSWWWPWIWRVRAIPYTHRRLWQGVIERGDGDAARD